MFLSGSDSPAQRPRSRPGKWRESVWLAHLKLLADLPYAPLTVAPALLDTLVAGFAADQAEFLWCGCGGDPRQLMPVNLYSQRFSEPVMRWVMNHQEAFTTLAPFEEQLRTDGESMRDLIKDPAYRHTAVFRKAMDPLGKHWVMGVPLLSASGECQGFLYVQRDGMYAPFSDAEQAQLRRARDRVKTLGSCAVPATASLPRMASRTALLRFDCNGCVRARSDNAFALLLYCHAAPLRNPGCFQRHDLAVLPDPFADYVGRMLNDLDAPGEVTLPLEHSGGLFSLRAERLMREDGCPEVLVAISQLEPWDLVVARQIRDWSLAPHEKKLVVALMHPYSQRELITHLNCTLGTLKGYINRLYGKLNIQSRDELKGLLEEQSGHPSFAPGGSQLPPDPRFVTSS